MACRCSTWSFISQFHKVKTLSQIGVNALGPNAVFLQTKMSCMKYYVNLVVKSPHKNLEWIETISDVNIISKEIVI